MSTTRIIGIDFGTSTTVVRVHNIGAENRIFPVAVNGIRTIPTIAFKQEENSQYYYGYDALAQINAEREGEIFRNFKMDLISDSEEKRNNAVHLVSGFLHYVYNEYSRQLNEGIFPEADITKVYVSHPAKWNSFARNIMKQCVAEVGFCSIENVSLKDEPTAAMLAAIHDKHVELRQSGLLLTKRKYKAMMIDMGAGTTDIVLCTYRLINQKIEIDDIFTYPPINNPGLCGGREIDNCLLDEARKFMGKMMQKTSSIGEKAINKLSRRVKEWKEHTISGALRLGRNVPEPSEITTVRDTLLEFGAPVLNGDERFTISRQQLEQFTSEHWTQLGNLINGAFTEVRQGQYAQLECPKDAEEVEMLVITGGHSQWYIVEDYLTGKKLTINLPKLNFSLIQKDVQRLVKTEDPQETVAVGLCYLDEDVVGSIAAANDVSIRFSCEGTYLGACDLIKKGTPLPFENTKINLKSAIKGNFIFRKELVVDYTVVTGETNEINKSVTVPSDDIIVVAFKTVLATLGVIIFDIPRYIYHWFNDTLHELKDDTILETIVNNNYNVTLSPNIKVNDEGIVTVGGVINLEGTEATIPDIII